LVLFSVLIVGDESDGDDFFSFQGQCLQPLLQQNPRFR